jgi:hypothetical protein
MALGNADLHVAIEARPNPAYDDHTFLNRVGASPPWAPHRQLDVAPTELAASLYGAAIKFCSYGKRYRFAKLHG